MNMRLCFYQTKYLIFYLIINIIINNLMNIPSNYKHLLKNYKALTNFFMKPYGLNVTERLCRSQKTVEQLYHKIFNQE
jgi:hypothetical protein